MTRQEAIKILMLSPFYFRLPLADRKELIREFCILHGKKDKWLIITKTRNFS